MLNRAAWGALVACAALGQTLPINHPSITSLPLSDPVTELIHKIEQGKTKLAFDPETGYLPAVLQALDIPLESQMAVFSKTSVQAMHIEPSNPRVVYFNDAVIAAWVRGGFVELASHDPRRGMVFYRLDQRVTTYRQRGDRESPFIRREDCLRCHLTAVTQGVPGVLLRSVFPSPSGVPIYRAPEYDTDGRMPFDKLWGGWYVTGDSGPAPHMGNLVVTDEGHPEAMLQSTPVHLDSLEGKCSPKTRLTPYSDIAALLVFEHQVRMMNLLTRAAWESRISLADTHSLSERARAALDELADDMLFAGEAPLRGEIKGTSGFTEAFASRGPRDSKGRSLRDLSLRGRLLRYPCSYMIYSAAFDALPDEAKNVVYRRIWQTLSVERQAIIEILRETKPGLPDYMASTR